jgi:hypothetical protein
VIIFNKWILDRFPFSITLTTWHMLFATISTQILARTTTFVDRSVVMNVRLYITAIIPVGMCFSLSLILSNVVYLYLSMSFIQMLKASKFHCLSQKLLTWNGRQSALLQLFLHAGVWEFIIRSPRSKFSSQYALLSQEWPFPLWENFNSYSLVSSFRVQPWFLKHIKTPCSKAYWEGKRK